jgi:hypothetical protein
MHVKFKNILDRFAKVTIQALDNNSYVLLKSCTSKLEKYGFCLSPMIAEQLVAPVIVKKGYVRKMVNGMAKLYIDLNWVNNSEGAIEQRIEMQVPRLNPGDSQRWVEVAVVDTNVETYTDTPTVTTETKLTYRIVSVGDSGEVPSEPVTVTFPPPLVVPTGLTASYRY